MNHPIEYQFIGAMVVTDGIGEQQVYNRIITVEMVIGSVARVTVPGWPKVDMSIPLGPALKVQRLLEALRGPIEEQQHRIDTSLEQLARVEARRARNRAEREGGTR